MFETIGFQSYVPYLIVLGGAPCGPGDGRLRPGTNPNRALDSPRARSFHSPSSGPAGKTCSSSSRLPADGPRRWVVGSGGAPPGTETGCARRGDPAAHLRDVSLAAGVLFLVVAAVELIVRRLRHLAAVLPAAIAYMYWYAFVGAQTVSGQSIQALKPLRSRASWPGAPPRDRRSSWRRRGTGLAGTFLLLVAAAFPTIEGRPPTLRLQSVLGPCPGAPRGVPPGRDRSAPPGTGGGCTRPIPLRMGDVMLPLAAALIGRPTFAPYPGVDATLGGSRRGLLLVDFSLVGNIVQLRRAHRLPRLAPTPFEPSSPARSARSERKFSNAIGVLRPAALVPGCASRAVRGSDYGYLVPRPRAGTGPTPAGRRARRVVGEGFALAGYRR